MRLLFNWRRKAMKKSFVEILRGGVYVAASALLIAAAVSCNVGLGESVDTEAPKLEITYPPVSAAIRDSFILYGTCSDDKEVTSVKVTMMDTATNETVLSEVSAQVNSDTWQIKLNSYDTSNSSYCNGWQFADGTYQVNVTAYDNAGHSSGTASRTFDIDNTPPVFIISNPGVVKTGTTSPSAYGSIFTVEGTIADDHTIGSMDVIIYNESGEVVSNETYNGEQISSFHEDDIPTAGGTSVIIAQYGSERYETLHSAAEGTEYYTASIKLTDNAKIYQNPTEESNSTTGNETYSLYLYDDVYTKLMSAKKGMGLSASDLKNIINGTAANEDAKAILDEKAISTEEKSDANNLYFSLNPQANPTYQVNGFAYDFAAGGTIQTASSGNALSITVSAGLDGTNIDLDGNGDTNATVKVWMKEYESKPSASGTYSQAKVLSDISALAAEVTKLENAEASFVQYKDASSENAVTETGGFKLIYDYAQNTSGNESSVSTKTFSVTIPEGSVSLGKYYIIAVTGSDVEDVVFLQDKVYGFEGNEAGVAPTVVIASPEGAAMKDTSDFSFSGTASLSSGSLYVMELRATLTVTDQNSNSIIGTYTEDISRTSADAVLSGSGALVCADGKNWTFTPSLLSGYAEIQAAEDSKKSYIYTLEIYGKSSSGHDTTVSSYVQIDSTPPVVEIASITPAVDGGEYDSSENTYVNGTVTVKGNIEETNLEKVTMQVFVGGEAASCFVDANGNAADILDLGKVYSFTQTIDTTSLTDAKSLDIRVTATDKVGNSATYSSLTAAGTSYGKLEILQETDRPKITLGNSSNSSDFTSGSANISEAKGNLFGTTSNNQLTATISDDDNIALVKVTVYDESGKLLEGSKIYTAYNGANPYTLSPGKSSASLTYYLPPDEGVYQVCIDAYDYLETETYTKSTGKVTTGKYFIAVSAGAPSITVDSYSNYQTESPTFSGKVSTFATGITATFVGADSSDASTYQKTLANQPTTFTATKTDGTWSGKLAENASKLSDGEYSILFTAENKYGQTSSTTVIFSVDTNAPTVMPVSESIKVNLDETSYVPLSVTASDSSGSEDVKSSGIANVYYFVDKEGTYASVSPAYENVSWNLMTQTATGYSATVNLNDYNITEDSEISVFFAAVDNATNKAVCSQKTTINCDKSKPVISVMNGSSSVASGETLNLNNATVNLEVTVTDTNVSGLKPTSDNASSSAVTVSDGTDLADGRKYTVSYTTLSDGNPTTLTLVATDKNGRTSDTFTVKTTCDTVAPIITINSPDESKILNTSPLVVEISVKENNYSDSNTSVSLCKDSVALYTQIVNYVKSSATDGTKTTVAQAKFYDVAEGTYTIKANSKDTYGNEAKEAEREIKYDKTAPATSLSGESLYDSNGAAASEVSKVDEQGSYEYLAKTESFTLRGTITEENFDSMSVTSGTATTPIVPESSSKWSYTPTVENDGRNTYKFTVKDLAGNQTSFTVYVTRDKTAPTVTITSPTNGSNSEYGNISVEVNANDSGSGMKEVSYRITSASDTTGTTPVASGTKNVSIDGTVAFDSITLSTEGAYILTATAKDVLGNERTLAPITFYYDKTGPVLDAMITSDTIGTKKIGETTYTVYASSSFAISATAIDAVSSVSSVLANSNTTLSESESSATTYTGTVLASVETNGTTSISVTALDNCGNKTEKKINNIAVDVTNPEVGIDSSSVPTSAKNAEFTLSGTASDDVAIKEVTVEDSVGNKSYTADVTDGKWTLTLTPSADGTGNDETKKYTADGVHTYTVKATDFAGHTSQKTCSVTTDVTRPEWATTQKDSSTTPYVNVDGKEVVSTSSPPETRTYYNSTSLTIAAKAKDATSGVKNITYTVTSTLDSSTTSGTADNSNFPTTFKEGFNSIKIKANDEAGNSTTDIELSFYVDSLAPSTATLKSVDSDTDVTSVRNYQNQEKQKLVNKDNDVTFTLAVADDTSSDSSTYSGIDSVSLTKIGNTKLSSAINGTPTDTNSTTGEKTFSITIPKANLSTGAVTVVVKDNAGNSSEFQMFNLLVDTSVPILTLTSPSDADTSTSDVTDVNKVISISGNASDNQNLEISSVKLEYKKKSETAEDSAWTELSTGDYSLSKSATVNSPSTTLTASGIDTTKFTDGGNIYIRAVANDAAGNSGTSNVLTLHVNQDSDRPVVKITNLTESNGTYILKYGTNAQITGTITDDDATSSQVVKTLVISESQYTGSEGETAEGKTTFKSSTGDFTFTPSNTEDGTKTFYIYIEDNNGNKFYTTAETYLENPKVYLKTTDLGNDKAKKEFTYRSDGSNPVVASGEGLVYSGDGKNYSVAMDSNGNAFALSTVSGTTLTRTENATLNAGFVAGGTARKYVKFHAIASDANGIEGMALTVTDANGNVKDRRTTAAEIGTATFVTTGDNSYTVDATGFSSTTDSSYATWTTDYIDVSSWGSGLYNVVFTPYDTSDLYGNGNYTFTVDNSGPAITVTTPTEYDSANAETSQKNGKVSFTGTIQDSNTVDAAYYYIPKSSETDEKSISGWTRLSSTVSLDCALDGLSSYCTDEYYTATGSYSSENAGTTTWYVIPVWFKATDEFGNDGYKKFSLVYNPDVDKPGVAITSPSLSETETSLTMGGTVKVIGSASMDSYSQEGITPYAVYLQIGTTATTGGTTTASYGDTAKSKVTDTYKYTVASKADVLTDVLGKTITSESDEYKNSNIDNNFWGIKITPTGSGTSRTWSTSLNTEGEMYESTTNTFALRACAVNSEGKMGEWSSETVITLDNNTPTYESKLLQFESALTAGALTAVPPTTVSAERDYSSGMFVKSDNWYVRVIFSHTSGMKDIDEVIVNNVSKSNYTYYNDTTNKKLYVYIPVEKTETTTGSYRVTATEKTERHSATATLSVNYDNNAPGMYALTDGTTSADNAISMTKLTNNNYKVKIGGSGVDAGAGIDFIALYFKRADGSKTTIELPLPEISSSAKGTSSTVTAGTAFISSSLQEEDGIYGISSTPASFTSDSGVTTITDATISTNSFIRTGSLVKIAGTYYEIQSVSASGGSVTINATFDTTPPSVFYAAAIAVNNQTAETASTSSGTTTISNDDGDGFADYVKNDSATGTFTWTLDFFSDELEDGPIDIVTVAFDKAGNSTSSVSTSVSGATTETKTKTSVMIANNTPRIAKVYLATDLNGDGTFTDNELGGQSIESSEGGTVSKSFYSALSGTQWNVTSGNLEGSGQPISTLSSQKDVKDSDGKYYGVGLTMRDTLGLAFEFVSGNEGNDDIYYNIAPSKDTDGILTEPTAGYDSSKKIAANTKFSESGETAPAARTLRGFNISSSDVTGKIAECNESTHSLSNIGITLWDSTKGTTPGKRDIVDETTGKITEFGSQWTVVNIPIYVDLVDDQRPVPSISDPEAATENDVAIGHVELKNTLPSKYFGPDNTDKEMDTDTKISGTVVFTGTVTDEKRVNSIKLKSGKAFNSTLTTDVEVASYSTESGSLVSTAAASATTGWSFEIESQSFSTSSGHTVNWKLTVDSSRVENIAAADVLFTLTASDGTNEDMVTYQVDIVPYITGITRTTKSAVSTTYRSTYGEYPVAVGDTLTVTGFNLPKSSTTTSDTTTVVKVGSNALATTVDTNGKQFTLADFTRSGELTVTVNGIVSLNDKNNNAVSTNQETAESAANNAKSSTVEGNVLYDNRYLRVWDVGHYFSNSTGGYEPTMAADNNGNLFTTWATAGTASVQFQKGLNKTNVPIYICYDQPDKTTALSVDTKSDSSGNLAAMFFPANVGDSGTPDIYGTGYSDTSNIGGVWGISLPKDMLDDGKYTLTATPNGNRDGTSSTTKNEVISNYKYALGQKHLSIVGNPYLGLDSKVCTSGYELASGAMRREVSQFEKPHTVRFGNNMHFIYYDTLNKALRYTYQETKTNAEQYINTNADTIVGWTLIDGGTDGQDRIHIKETTSFADIVSAYSGTGVTLNKELSVKKGDTVCISYLNKSGIYKTVLRTVESAFSGKSVGVDKPAPSDISTVNGGAIYTGDSSVVTKGETISSSAGSYASIDVTKSGKPVIVYYDAGSNSLRIAYSSSEKPSMTDVASGRDTWTRQTVSGVSGGTYVQAKIDGDNYLHILYRDSQGQLCYIRSSNNPDGDAYKFDNTSEVIDTSGTYGTLSLIKSTSGDTTTYIPCVSWLNSEGTANGVKYAVLRDVDTGATKDGKVSNGEPEVKSAWDTMIVPAVEGHFISGGEYVYVEGNPGSWSVTDGVSTGECDAIIGYNTGRMDVLFLKSEQSTSN